MLDELHDHDLALDPEQHLQPRMSINRTGSLLTRTGRAHLVRAVMVLLARLRHDLDRRILARHLVLGQFDASCQIRSRQLDLSSGRRTATHRTSPRRPSFRSSTDRPSPAPADADASTRLPRPQSSHLLSAAQTSAVAGPQARFVGPKARRKERSDARCCVRGRCPPRVLHAQTPPY